MKQDREHPFYYLDAETLLVGSCKELCVRVCV